jgi:hypothetical protein
MKCLASALAATAFASAVLAPVADVNAAQARHHRSWRGANSAAAGGRDAGILYEIWHTGAAHLMHLDAAAGGPQLTVERVIRSDGNLTLDDVFAAGGVAPGFGPDIYNVEPALGPLVLFRSILHTVRPDRFAAHSPTRRSPTKRGIHDVGARAPPRAPFIRFVLSPRTTATAQNRITPRQNYPHFTCWATNRFLLLLPPWPWRERDGRHAVVPKHHRRRHAARSLAHGGRVRLRRRRHLQLASYGAHQPIHHGAQQRDVDSAPASGASACACCVY